ncbi:hypothetical protein EST38_g10046 [Candolleomyces aberdarensis]|uniref:Uncharacterized protein n=1 Tax=Candolleomyces aberdarensis TaxID=2316362 RepID=A0A4Q2DAK4_9AGAR|nr:hypothetical protein EST38_g10046 [Candolleomyces aberdarensis]
MSEATSILYLRGILNSIERYPGFYTANEEKLAASDLAFFAHNASLDNGPSNSEAFHRRYFEARRTKQDENHRAIIELRARRAVFDQAALLDQVTGGTTLVVHIPGAQVPGTPARPEFLKANVYVPSTVIREIESKGRINPVPEIVRMLIRELGVPTVQRYDRIHAVVSPRKDTVMKTPKSLPIVEGMPLAIPENSCRYLFYGRAVDQHPNPSSYFAPSKDEEDTQEIDEGSDTDDEDGGTRNEGANERDEDTDWFAQVSEIDPALYEGMP